MLSDTPPDDGVLVLPLAATMTTGASKLENCVMVENLWPTLILAVD